MDAIRIAYFDLAPELNALVPLTAIRAALGDISRDGLDKALIWTAHQPDVTLVSQQQPTTDDEAASVEFRGERCHAIHIYTPTSDGDADTPPWAYPAVPDEWDDHPG